MSAYFINTLLQFATACKPGSSFLGFPTWYKYLDSQTVAGQCSVVFNFPGDIGKILLAVVDIMLRLAALIAVGFVIYGGFKFILSQGDPEQINAARSTVINAVIGLVIAIIATFIVSFVFSNLAK